MALQGTYETIKQAFQDLIAPQLQEIRGDIAGVRGEMEGLRGQVDGLRGVMRQFEKRVDERMGSLEMRMQEGLGSLEKRMEEGLASVRGEIRQIENAWMKDSPPCATR